MKTDINQLITDLIDATVLMEESRGLDRVTLKRAAHDQDKAKVAINATVTALQADVTYSNAENKIFRDALKAIMEPGVANADAFEIAYKAIQAVDGWKEYKDKE